MHLRKPLALLCAAMILAACADRGALRPDPNDIPCVQTSHGCIALNPDVNQANVDRTICVSGYTKSVRPGTGYTNGVKAKLLRESGRSLDHMADYELDHIVPLAVGGHPRKLSNLMLQPWTGESSAKEKDVLEVQLQHRVCRHQMALAAAQRCIAENWHACAASIAGGGGRGPSR